MAPILTLTDGTNNITLNSGNAQILNYLPSTPSQRATAVTKDIDGGEQANTFWDNVTEVAVIIYGTASQARSALTDINRFFEMARQRQRLQSGPTIKILYAPFDTEPAYSSEVLAGKVAINDEIGRQLIISWTRRYYWQSETETQLNMTNDLVGSPTGTLTLANQRRGGYTNYGRITGSDIGGDLPTPAKLVLTNTYNNLDYTRNFYLGHFIETNGLLPNIIECDTGNAVNSSTIVGQNVVLATTSAGTTKHWYGSISNALLQATAGGIFRILAKTDTVTGVAGLQLKAKISIDQLYTVYEGDFVAVPTSGAGVIDLGSVQLPPSGIAGSTYPLTLELFGRYTGSSSTIPIDYIQLTPTNSYRVLKAKGFNTGYLAWLTDDPYNKAVYTDGWSTSGKLFNYVPSGNPIMLVPGKTNTIYLLTESAEALRTTTLQVYYRRRRLII